MKLKNIIANLDKSETNRCESITWDMEHFLRELGLSCWGVQQSPSFGIKLKSYWVANHYCTDSYVGLRAYFLEDVLVCLTLQSGRKCDEIFEWASVKAQVDVRSYILSLEEEDSFEPETENLIDMEEDLGTGYPLEYVGQSLRNEVSLHGEMVTIIKEDSDGYKNFHTITVRDEKGAEYEADIRDVLVPWYIV